MVSGQFLILKKTNVLLGVELEEVHVPHKKLSGDGEASPVVEQAVQKRKAEDKLISGGDDDNNIDVAPW